MDRNELNARLLLICWSLMCFFLGVYMGAKSY